MATIHLRVNGWDKHQRKDVKRPTWFAFDNRTIEDEDFFNFTHGEFKTWVYILSKASQKLTSEVRLSSEHASRVCNISEKDFKSAIQKLESLGIVTVLDTDTSRARHADVTDTSRGRDVTLQTDKTDITLQTGQDRDLGGDPPAPRDVPVPIFHPLLELWNENCGTLPKVKKNTPERNREAQKLWASHSGEEIVEAIKNLARSDFCNGKNDRGWVATPDWFLNPKNFLKAFENKFENRGAHTISHAQRRENNLDALREKWEVEN